MTEKELLYYEDAIMHEVNTISICEYIIDNLDDNSLINFMKKELKKHEDNKNTLLDVMEAIANE